MGAQVSTDKSQTEIVNEFVTNVCTNVTNSYKRAIAASQEMKIGCDPDVYKTCLNNNVAAISQIRTEYTDLLKGGFITEETYKERIKVLETKGYMPLPCCSWTDINQEMVLDISITDTANNNVANEIKSQIKGALEKEKTSNMSGTVGYAEHKNEAITRIQNKVENNFPVDIVNETINSFNFDQKMDLSNSTQSNVTQKTVANILATTIVDTMIKNDADLMTDVSTTLRDTATQSGALDNIEGVVSSFFNAYTMIVIAVVIGAVIIGAILLKAGVIPMLFGASSGNNQSYHPDKEYQNDEEDGRDEYSNEEDGRGDDRRDEYSNEEDSNEEDGRGDDRRDEYSNEDDYGEDDRRNGRSYV